MTTAGALGGLDGWSDFGGGDLLLQLPAGDSQRVEDSIKPPGDPLEQSWQGVRNEQKQKGGIIES